MKYEIQIKRCRRGSNQPYLQSFLFEGTGEETIATVLDRLNNEDDLFDKDGKPADRILWSCSCNQGVCGACSMVINGVPALACKTKLKQCKETVILLEPLRKFPLVGDLKTDRSALYEAPIVHEIWNAGEAKYHEALFSLECEAAKCIKCGICLEVCPNTGANSHNLGAAFAAECFLSYAQSEDQSEKKHLKQEYNKSFALGCSKSFACMDHCPAKIDLREIIAKMNR